MSETHELSLAAEMLQTERKVSKVLEAYARRSIELDNAKAEGQSEQVDLFNQRGLRSLRLRSLMRAGWESGI